jgi:hypothetical protein
MFILLLKPHGAVYQTLIVSTPAVKSKDALPKMNPRTMNNSSVIPSTITGSKKSAFYLPKKQESSGKRQKPK